MNDDFNQQAVMFYVLGSLVANDAAQSVIDNQNRIELDRRWREDPVWRARLQVWRSYDRDFQDRAGRHLTSIGSLLLMSVFLYFFVLIAWVVGGGLLFGLNATNSVVANGPSVVLTVLLVIGSIGIHRDVLARVSGEERRLLHHHRGHFHAHDHTRQHGHHPLDDPPVPPGRGPGTSITWTTR